jgi:hypothetical protein
MEAALSLCNAERLNLVRRPGEYELGQLPSFPDMCFQKDRVCALAADGHAGQPL